MEFLFLALLSRLAKNPFQVIARIQCSKNPFVKELQLAMPIKITSASLSPNEKVASRMAFFRSVVGM